MEITSHLLDMDLQATFLSNVRARLESRQWTQADLAKKMRVSPSHWSQLFSGYRKPGLKTIEMAARALGVSPIELLVPADWDRQVKDAVSVAIKSAVDEAVSTQLNGNKKLRKN